MSQTKTIDYQAFYEFITTKAQEKPDMALADALKAFETKDVYVSEYDRAMYEMEKNGHKDDRIQADAQHKTWGSTY